MGKRAAWLLFVLLLLAGMPPLFVVGAPEEEENLNVVDFSIRYTVDESYRCLITEDSTSTYGDDYFSARHRELDLTVRVNSIENDYPMQLSLHYNADKQTVKGTNQEETETEGLTGNDAVFDRGVNENEIGGRTLTGAVQRHWRVANWDNFWLPAEPVAVGDTWEPSAEQCARILSYSQTEDETGMTLEPATVGAKLESLEDGVATVIVTGEAKGAGDETAVAFTASLKLTVHYDTVIRRVSSWSFERKQVFEYRDGSQIVSATTTEENASATFEYPETAPAK